MSFELPPVRDAVDEFFQPGFRAPAEPSASEGCGDWLSLQGGEPEPLNREELAALQWLVKRGVGVESDSDHALGHRVIASPDQLAERAADSGLPPRVRALLQDALKDLPQATLQGLLED